MTKSLKSAVPTEDIIARIWPNIKIDVSLVSLAVELHRREGGHSRWKNSFRSHHLVKVRLPAGDIESGVLAGNLVAGANVLAAAVATDSKADVRAGMEEHLKKATKNRAPNAVLEAMDAASLMKNSKNEVAKSNAGAHTASLFMRYLPKRNFLTKDQLLSFLVRTQPTIANLNKQNLKGAVDLDKTETYVPDVFPPKCRDFSYYGQLVRLLVMDARDALCSLEKEKLRISQGLASMDDDVIDVKNEHVQNPAPAADSENKIKIDDDDTKQDDNKIEVVKKKFIQPMISDPISPTKTESDKKAIEASANETKTTNTQAEVLGKISLTSTEKVTKDSLHPHLVSDTTTPEEIDTFVGHDSIQNLTEPESANDSKTASLNFHGYDDANKCIDWSKDRIPRNSFPSSFLKFHDVKVAKFALDMNKSEDQVEYEWWFRNASRYGYECESITRLHSVNGRVSGSVRNITPKQYHMLLNKRAVPVMETEDQMRVTKLTWVPVHTAENPSSSSSDSVDSIFQLRRDRYRQRKAAANTGTEATDGFAMDDNLIDNSRRSSISVDSIGASSPVHSWSDSSESNYQVVKVEKKDQQKTAPKPTVKRSKMLLAYQILELVVYVLDSATETISDTLDLLSNYLQKGGADDLKKLKDSSLHQQNIISPACRAQAWDILGRSLKCSVHYSTDDENKTHFQKLVDDLPALRFILTAIIEVVDATKNNAFFALVDNDGELFTTNMREEILKDIEKELQIQRSTVMRNVVELRKSADGLDKARTGAAVKKIIDHESKCDGYTKEEVVYISTASTYARSAVQDDYEYYVEAGKKYDKIYTDIQKSYEDAGTDLPDYISTTHDEITKLQQSWPNYVDREPMKQMDLFTRVDQLALATKEYNKFSHAITSKKLKLAAKLRAAKDEKKEEENDDDEDSEIAQ